LVHIEIALISFIIFAPAGGAQRSRGGFRGYHAGEGNMVKAIRFFSQD